MAAVQAMEVAERRLSAVRAALASAPSAITAGPSEQRLRGLGGHVIGATQANNAEQDRERDEYYAAHRTIVEYTPGQSMHIFHPRDFQPNYSVEQGWNPEAIPAIVFFPGGGFRNCGQTAFYRQAVHLARRGMVAGVCSYKVESEPTQATRDAGVAEAASAVEFVRKHAVELNVDARRVVASGGSAGGYIAAGACFVPLGSGGPSGAGCPNLAVVRFVLVCCSTTCVSFIVAASSVSQLFNPATGAPPRGDRPDHPNLPVHHIVSGGPPTLILHGEADTSVPYARIRVCSDGRRFVLRV